MVKYLRAYQIFSEPLILGDITLEAVRRRPTYSSDIVLETKAPRGQNELLILVLTKSLENLKTFC